MTQASEGNERMGITAAERFLHDHYQDDILNADQIRRDAEHWNLVLGDPEKYPNADLEWICQFDEAACAWLGGLSHSFAVEQAQA